VETKDKVTYACKTDVQEFDQAVDAHGVFGLEASLSLA
jgi:hypothetical protein